MQADGAPAKVWDTCQHAAPASFVGTPGRSNGAEHQDSEGANYCNAAQIENGFHHAPSD
jgi:hypothetical protein